MLHTDAANYYINNILGITRNWIKIDFTELVKLIYITVLKIYSQNGDPSEAFWIDFNIGCPKNGGFDMNVGTHICGYLHGIH